MATRKQSKPRPRVEYLQQAISFVAEGRGDLVPEHYLYFILGMVSGALARRRPRAAA